MRVGALALLLSLVGCSAFAQDYPRAEVFGGYSYLNLDVNDLGPRESANGWEASVSGNLNRWLAIEGSVAGYYKTYTVDLNFITPGLGTFDIKARDYSYLAGPRFNFRPVFVHALVGGDHLSGSALGISASQDGFAAAFGGGVEWKVAPQWAIRGSGDYVLTRHNIFGGPAFNQNNFRVSAGVVYLFGARGEERSHNRTLPRREESARCLDETDAALLGVRGCPIESGFRVTTVKAESPGSRAGITTDDIIIAINDRPVRNAQEIETAVGSSKGDTVTVTYLIKGNWKTAREVKVR
jgi:membrane-associated protease RseP (regulator of RpoE activity)